MKKIKEKSIIIKTPQGEKLWGVLSLPERKGKFPAALIAHGFNGTKSQPKFVKLGRKFAQNGIAVLRFDFSGCGDSEGEFQKMRISQQVKELAAACQFLIKQSRIDEKRIGFLGYSLGALVVCLFQLKKSVAETLVLVAPALDQKDLIKIWCPSEQIRTWRQQGYIDMPKSRMGVQYLNEAKNYSKIASGITASTLIIHGNKDEDVPLKFSRKLEKVLGGEKKLLVVKKADHNFESYQASRELIRQSLRWFKKYL